VTVIAADAWTGGLLVACAVAVLLYGDVMQLAEVVGLVTWT